PGLIGYEDGQPAAALLWKFLDPKKEVAAVDLFVESPQASVEMIDKLLAGFLAKTEQARAICFEVWTPPEARIHRILPNYGFVCRHRRLMQLARTSTGAWPTLDGNCVSRDGVQFRSLNDLNLSMDTLESLAGLLSEAYAGTGDAEFYHYFYTEPHGQRYLLQAFASPVFDFKNSSLACSAPDRQPIGLSMCFRWSHAQTLYIEQLAVDR